MNLRDMVLKEYYPVEYNYAIIQLSVNPTHPSAVLNIWGEYKNMFYDHSIIIIGGEHGIKLLS